MKMKKKQKAKFPEEKQKTQTTVDTQLLSLISKVQHMKPYLSSYFTLKAGQPPHLIKF